jgi:neutral ceramidase
VVPAGATAATPPAESAAAKGPRVGLKVLTRQRSALLRRRRMRVRIRYGAAGRLRVVARFRRPGRRRLARFTRLRKLRFRAPGRRVVRLRLTGGGRSVARKRGCSLRIGVVARGKPRGPQRSRRTRRTIRLGPRSGINCAALQGPGPSPAGPFRAGAASADITPPIGTPMFAYTARSGLANPEGGLQIIGDPDENLYAKTFVPSEGIHTRVRARALVLSQRGRKFALVQADLGGLPYALTQEVTRRIADTGITGDRLLLAATHTHSSTGPIWPSDSSGYALLGGDAFDPRAFEVTAQGIAEAIRMADEHLEPARLGSATSSLRGASRNRAFDAYLRNPEAPEDETQARQASIDPEVTVIRVDSASGRPIAAWSSFAVHPTSFGDENLLFSGDNVATAERVAERGMAAASNTSSPDRPPVNIWTNSHEGDVSPDGGPDREGEDPLQYVPNSFASANLAGARVGEGVLRAWRSAGESMSPEVALDARRTFLAFDGTAGGGEPVGPNPVLGAGGIVADDGFCAPFDNFAGPGQGRKFPALQGAGLVPSINPVAVWRVGALGIVALPSEVTTQMGRRIRTALSDGSRGAVVRVTMAGLANGYVSYTATPEEYDHCGYEGSFTLFGRRQGARWIDAAQAAMTALVDGLPGDDGAGEPPQLGFGLPPAAPVDETPAAGEAVAQPADQVRRYERAVFSWRGGDPAVDAPRGSSFVVLERLSGSSWIAVGSDDSESDITALGSDGLWTETWQFGPCDPLGTYRFRVSGVANKGSGPAPYGVVSESFELLPTAPLATSAPVVSGGVASVTATYPDPGEGALLALPRRVRSGTATLSVNGQQVAASIDSARLHFTTPAEAGATVSVSRVDDGCGNTAP